MPFPQTIKWRLYSVGNLDGLSKAVEMMGTIQDTVFLKKTVGRDLTIRKLKIWVDGRERHPDSIRRPSVLCW